MTMPSVTNSAENNTTGTATSVDVSLTVSSASDRVLICFANLYGNGDGYTISSVVFDPGGSDEDNFTNEAGASANNWTGSILERSEAWYLVLNDGVSSGSYTVRVTASAIVGRLAGHAWEVADADTADPLGASSASTGTMPGGSPFAISTTVTTTAANSLVGGGGNVYANATWSPQSGTDEVTEQGSPQNTMSSTSVSKDTTSTGDYTPTTDASSGANDPWAMGGIEILEASGITIELDAA